MRALASGYGSLDNRRSFRPVGAVAGEERPDRFAFGGVSILAACVCSRCSAKSSLTALILSAWLGACAAPRADASLMSLTSSCFTATFDCSSWTLYMVAAAMRRIARARARVLWRLTPEVVVASTRAALSIFRGGGS